MEFSENQNISIDERKTSEEIPGDEQYIGKNQIEGYTLGQMNEIKKMNETWKSFSQQDKINFFIDLSEFD